MAATAYARRLTKPPSMFRGLFLLNRRDTQLPGHFQHQGFSPHFSQDSKKLRYGVWRLLKVFCRPTNRTRCRFGFGSVHLVQKLTHAHHSHTKPGHGFLGHVLETFSLTRMTLYVWPGSSSSASLSTACRKASAAAATCRSFRSTFSGTLAKSTVLIGTSHSGQRAFHRPKTVLRLGWRDAIGLLHIAQKFVIDILCPVGREQPFRAHVHEDIGHPLHKQYTSVQNNESVFQIHERGLRAVRAAEAFTGLTASAPRILF